MAGDWWLIGNTNWGVHVAQGRSAKEAKADVRDRIAETYAAEGLSASACRRAASSYKVFAIAGHLAEKDVRDAKRAWDRDDTEPAEELRRHHRRKRNREAMGGLQTTRYSYQPIATCEGSDQWVFEDPDPARMRRAARKHAADTGHTVRVDHTSSTVYRKTQGEPES